MTKEIHACMHLYQIRTFNAHVHVVREMFQGLIFGLRIIGTFDRYNIDVYSIRELPTSDLWLLRSVTVRDLVVYITRIMSVVPILTDMFWGIKRKNSVSETSKV